MAVRSGYLIGKRRDGDGRWEAFHASNRRDYTSVARGHHRSLRRAHERAAKANLIAGHAFGDAVRGRAKGRARRIIGKYMGTPAHELKTREREELRRAMKTYYGDAGMTRKHFQAVASTLAAIDDPTRRHEETERWIPTLRAQNPRFDAERFRRYVDAQAAKQSRAAGAAFSRGAYASRGRGHRHKCGQCGALGGGHFKTCARRARSWGSRVRRLF